MQGFIKDRIWDYIILAARVLLAFMLVSYGFAKLTAGQFGITKEAMNLPLKDIDLFRLSWYLADHQPFKSFIGISQIVTGLLLVYSRTLLIGAFMSLPIWMNILVWDITFMGIGNNPFLVRIPYYLLLTFLIIWHYRKKVNTGVRELVSGTSTRFAFPLWAWLLLPLAAIALELTGSIPMVIRYLLHH